MNHWIDKLRKTLKSMSVRVFSLTTMDNVGYLADLFCFSLRRVEINIYKFHFHLQQPLLEPLILE